MEIGKQGVVEPGRDEKIADGREDGEEPLQASQGSKALHCLLTPALSSCTL